MTRDVRSALTHAVAAFAVVVFAVALVWGLLLAGVLSPNSARWDKKANETTSTIVIYP